MYKTNIEDEETIQFVFYDLYSYTHTLTTTTVPPHLSSYHVLTRISGTNRNLLEYSITNQTTECWYKKKINQLPRPQQKTFTLCLLYTYVTEVKHIKYLCHYWWICITTGSRDTRGLSGNTNSTYISEFRYNVVVSFLKTGPLFA